MNVLLRKGAARRMMSPIAEKARLLAKLNGDEEVEKNSEDLWRSAVGAICAGEFLRARRLLRESMVYDMEDPRAYNLLGISYEKEGNRHKAGRFYRVAYHMDQSFQAAYLNLERVGTFGSFGDTRIYWGLDMREVLT